MKGLRLVLLSGLVAALVLAAQLCVSCGPAGPVSAAYGAQVRYRPGQMLRFPDLTLVYRGERQGNAGPQFPRGFTYHDFRAEQGEDSQDVSWTAGTGDIGPTVFEFAGHTYRLELRQSDELGRLADDELVLWQD